MLVPIYDAVIVEQKDGLLLYLKEKVSVEEFQRLIPYAGIEVRDLVGMSMGISSILMIKFTPIYKGQDVLQELKRVLEAREYTKIEVRELEVVENTDKVFNWKSVLKSTLRWNHG